jgi:hypothetical protein
MNKLTLAALHRKSVAVEFVIRGISRVLFGEGIYEPNSDPGSLLRIESRSSSGYDVELLESSWKGEILSGKPYGCDFLLRII